MRIFDLNPFYVGVLISSVIRQKGKSRNGCFKKTKHVKFSEKRSIVPPDTHSYVYVSGCKECSFSGKFDELCFLETPVSRFELDTVK